MNHLEAGRARFELYLDAVRCMTARQLLHRLRRLLPMRLVAAGTGLRDSAAWRPLASGLSVDEAPQSGPTPPPAQDATFVAVGQRRRFDDDVAFWRPGDAGLLFAFHLHGFADLARYAATEPDPEHDAFWIGVITSWLDREGQPSMPGWHPYPMSWRIASWCSALSRGGWPSGVQKRMLRSLVRQAQVLARSVEHDIGGNHVLRNASALVFAGVCLGEKRLERRGMRVLRRELPRQILADGGHEERSTAYHRAMLMDVDDVEVLLGRAGRAVPTWLTETRGRMTRWDRAMRGPDGRLPLLNDAWDGPALQEERPAEATTNLQPSGYVVLRHREDQAIFDVGLVAPPHLPPHAHADALSFVLWADGRPLIADAGSFTYHGPERRPFRSTAAHSTVEVDGTDQCELWGDFRAAFMPRVELCDLRVQDEATVIVGRHDGYRRLPDPVVHQRTLCWLPGDGVVVVDELLGAGSHQVCSRLHLAPAIRVSDSEVGPLRLEALGPGPPYGVRAGRCSAYIGQATATEVIERSFDAMPRAPFGWALLRPGAQATLDGRTLTVQRADGRTFTLAA